MATKDRVASGPTPVTGGVHRDLSRTPEDIVTQGPPEDPSMIGKKSDDHRRGPIPAESEHLTSPQLGTDSPSMRGETNREDKSADLDRNC